MRPHRPYLDGYGPTSLLLADGTRGRQLLLDASTAMQQPSTQTVYSTGAELTAACGRTFTEWYVCNIASGDLTGSIASTALTNGGGTFYYQRLWPGWNGTDMTSGFRAIEFAGTSSTAQGFAGSTSLYNLSTSLCFVINARCLRPPAAARSLFSKQSSYASTSPGYTAYITNGGAPILGVADGSTIVTAAALGAVTDIHAFATGSPQWMAFKINVTTGKHQVLAYRTAGAEANTPAGTKTNSVAFRFGGGVFNSCETLQVLQWGVLTGAEAEAFTIDDLNELDDWCRVPDILAHYVRRNHIAPIVGTNSDGVVVQHCFGSATTTTLNHFAHGYNANSTDSTQKLGWYSHRATSTSSDTAAANLKRGNRLLRTDDLSDAAWTKTNVTATKNAGTDPAGFRGAASLTASANNGTVTQDFTGEVDEVHTVSVFARRNGASDVACRLILANSADDSELGAADITVTDDWQRFSVEVDDTAVGVTTLRWKLRINTSGESVYATFAQGEYDTLSAYQPNQGTKIDRDDVEWYIDNSDGSKYDPRGGRIEITVIGDAAVVNSTGCFIFTTDAGASNEDRHFIQRDALASLEAKEVRIYDGSGNIVSMLDDIADVTNTDECTYVSEWEAHRPLPGYATRAIAELNGTVTTTGTTTATTGWTPGSNADRIMPGMRHNYLAHLEGIITSLKIWGRLT